MLTDLCLCHVILLIPAYSSLLILDYSFLLTQFLSHCVITVRLGPFFSFTYSLPPPLHYHTTDTPLSFLVIALSWTYLLTPRLGQDALRTVRLPPIYYMPYPRLYCTFYACIGTC